MSAISMLAIAVILVEYIVFCHNLELKELRNRIKKLEKTKGGKPK